jgi:hypothetical protein
MPAGGAAGVVPGLLADVIRSKRELLVENAMLRQQLVVATRRLKRARFKVWDRVILVALSTCSPVGGTLWSWSSPKLCCAGTERDSVSCGHGVRNPRRSQERAWR